MEPLRQCGKRLVDDARESDVGVIGSCVLFVLLSFLLYNTNPQFAKQAKRFFCVDKKTE